MPFTKIVPADLQGKGVIGQPAVPGLSVSEMQESVEQIVREVAIPAVNRLVEELGATTAAGNIGATVPDGLSAEPTVQDVMSAIHEAANSGKDEVAEDLEQHKNNMSNPHAVTAAQTGAYTKEETEAAIDAKVVQIGAADMAKAVYDPNDRGNMIIPIGFIFAWSPVSGGPDLSTAEKVSSYFGFGTWAAYGSGRVLVGIDDAQPQFNPVGKTAGQISHTLTEAELPVVSPQLLYAGTRTPVTLDAGGTPGHRLTFSVGNVAANNLISTFGGGQPHTNLQPYIVVYYWQRIA